MTDEAKKEMDDKIAVAIKAAIKADREELKAANDVAEFKKRAEEAEAQQTGIISWLNNTTKVGQYAHNSHMVSLWTLIILVVGYLAGYFSHGTNFDLVKIIKTTFNL